MLKPGVRPAWPPPKSAVLRSPACLPVLWVAAACAAPACAQAPGALQDLASVPPIRLTVPGLPDAPLPTPFTVALNWQAEAQTASGPGQTTTVTAPQSQPGPRAQASSTLTGVVSDPRGGLISGATVTLASKDGQVSRESTSDATGRYTFTGLPAGSYTITLAAPGLGKIQLTDMPVTAGQTFEAPEVPLPLATTRADVEVYAGQEQVAAAQLHIQEQQRVLGVIPNFYTSFIWDAAPLTRKQKFNLMFHSTLDPVTFATTALIAGGEQVLNRFPGYGDGAEGYGKRYGAAYADGFIGRFLGAAVFPSLLGQDPRYFYQGTGTVRSRAYHAISSAVISRGDSGHRQLFYSHILGNFAAGGIANLYHPAGDRGAGLTVSTALIGLGASAGVNVIREFLLKPFTSKVPGYANGKPANTALKQ